MSGNLILSPIMYYSGHTGIVSPLSTTSSFAVAVNFAADGAIIQLQPQQDVEWKNELNVFSVSWLSDFPNEKEYLFFQEGLQLSSVWLVNDGFEIDGLVLVLSKIRQQCDNDPNGLLWPSEHDRDVMSMIIRSTDVCDNEYVKQTIDAFFRTFK